MSNRLIQELTMGIADGLQSQSLTSCLRWANKRRIMTGDFPGPFSTKYHPWVREMHNSKAPTNYSMKGAQLGVTEVLINLAFFTIDMRHKDVLYVLPTSKNASDFSKARFNAALKESPYLNTIFTDTNSIELKQAGSNTLYIRGSRGDSNLKSVPVSVLLLDEVDDMSQRAINLALERLSGHISKTVWGISTPTIPNYGIHKLYMSSTQEHFVFKCPCCSRLTKLIWPDCVKIIGVGVNDPQCHASYLRCKECKGKLEQLGKPDWLRRASWEVTNKNSNPDIRGFHISQLYSYTISPGELAVAHFKGFGDEAANIEFHNSKLGQPFIGDGAKLTDTDIDDCIANYAMDDDRPEVGCGRLITMGVDQGKFLHIEITEWFFDELTVNLNTGARAKVLWQGKFSEEDWDQLDILMREFQVQHAVVDIDPQVIPAKHFARRNPGYVTLSRFRRGVTAKEISIADEGDDAPIATVDRTTWFSTALGRFRKPRRIQLPHDISLEYREHLKAPIRTYVRSGTSEDARKKQGSSDLVAKYISTSPDHYALARVYSEIALPLAASHVSGENVARFL